MAGMSFWCFVGGFTALYPRSYRCRLRDLSPDAYRVRSPRRCVWKDVDTSDTAVLTVTWRSLDLRVAPKSFLRTDVANDDTRIIFSSCGVTSRIFLMIPVCLRNVHHLSQLPDFLVAVDLLIPLVVSRMLIMKISRR